MATIGVDKVTCMKIGTMVTINFEPTIVKASYIPSKVKTVLYKVIKRYVAAAATTRLNAYTIAYAKHSSGVLSE
jgi:hypothetical protein